MDFFARRKDFSHEDTKTQRFDVAMLSFATFAASREKWVRVKPAL
jgi:hypothetical protein